MHQPPKPAAKGITSTPQRNNDLARVAELARTGKLHEAVAITEWYLRPGTSDPDFLRYRAVLEKHLGNMSAALRWAAAAEAVFSHPDTLLILARADMRAGNTEQALERCRRILHMSPGNAQARLLLAETFESAVRVDEATAPIEVLCVKRGDVTIHDEWVVHGSGGNLSKGTRRTYVAAFRTADTVARERKAGFSHSHMDTVNWDNFDRS